MEFVRARSRHGCHVHVLFEENLEADRKGPATDPLGPSVAGDSLPRTRGGSREPDP